MAQADNDKGSAGGGGGGGRFVTEFFFLNWRFRTFPDMKAKALSGQNIALNDTKSSHSFQYLTNIIFIYVFQPDFM